MAVVDCRAMAYVPGFANDLFISYSHIDNQAVDASEGWVTAFHKHLQIEVEEELGDRVQIWRDPRIGSADDFSRDLDRQVRSSAMLLAVLSPAYGGSAWCEREAKGFISGARRAGNLWVDTKCRLAKIVKRPADVTLLPETGALKFFEVDGHSGRPYEMDPGSKVFNRSISDLGLEIGTVLRAMRRSRTVFVGHASTALAMQRDRVKRELQARDFRVVTVSRSSLDEPIEAVRRALKECALAVLFDGQSDKGSADSADALARDERTAATEVDVRQLVVLHGQQMVGTEHNENVELMPDPPQHTLNHTMLQMLDAPEESGRSARPLVRVYLICDRQDHPLLQHNHARELRDFLIKRGLEVKTPLAEDSEAAEFSRDNRTKLKQCDGVLVYWGTARQSWFDQRLSELMQARGWRRGRDFAAIAAYIADPENTVKANYQTREVDELIKQFKAVDFSDSAFARFIQRLTAAAQ
jgi:hypothetical protein